MKLTCRRHSGGSLTVTLFERDLKEVAGMIVAFLMRLPIAGERYRMMDTDCRMMPKIEGKNNEERLPNPRESREFSDERSRPMVMKHEDDKPTLILDDDNCRDLEDCSERV